MSESTRFTAVKHTVAYGTLLVAQSSRVRSATSTIQ